MRVDEEAVSEQEFERTNNAVSNRVDNYPRRETTGGSASQDGQRSTRLHPLVELTLARLREFLREPEAVFWVFVFPVLLAFALGLAFRNNAPEPVRIAVETNDESSQNIDSIIDALQNHPEDVRVVALSSPEAARDLRTGRVALVMTVQEGADGALPRVRYRYDPSRPESRQARSAADDALQRALGRRDIVAASDEHITETGARYIDYLIPGLIGLNLMGSGMWGLGFGIVQARTRKLLKRFAATPMRRSHYLLSFMLSRLVFLALEVAAVIIFAWIVFGVQVRGSFVSLIIILLLGALMFAGIGLLVAARAKTVEGVSGWMNLVMVPMWLASGTFFSSSRFPEAIQPVIQVLPLTALNDSLRAVMNEAAPLAGVLPDMGVMALWSVGSFLVALRIFRWQ